MFLGVLMPFVGTTLGALMVFFMNDNISNKTNGFLSAFSSGVMISASIWSLILPAMDLSQSMGKFSWLPTTIGIVIGVTGLLFIEKFVIKITKKNLIYKANGINKNSILLFLAITLHNIPEGMAVGVAWAGFLLGEHSVSFMGAMMLSIGIAIQNIPEGAIISMPLKSKGFSKTKSFLGGFLSGMVEPIASIITILLMNIVVPILPYLLSFASGAMIFVVVADLIPDSQKCISNNSSCVGFVVGFLVMMILDVMLG